MIWWSTALYFTPMNNETESPTHEPSAWCRSFEFIRIGAYVKVIAVDERTGTEVSMVGDPRAAAII